MSASLSRATISDDTFVAVEKNTAAFFLLKEVFFKYIIIYIQNGTRWETYVDPLGRTILAASRTKGGTLKKKKNHPRRDEGTAETIRATSASH